MRNKFPLVEDLKSDNETDDDWKDEDMKSKVQGKINEDKARGAKTSEIELGDLVIRKDTTQKSKWATNFVDDPMQVVSKNKSDVTVKSMSTGTVFRRNVSQLKNVDKTVASKATGEKGKELESSSEEEQPAVEEQSGSPRKATKRSREVTVGDFNDEELLSSTPVAKRTRHGTKR